ncbi:sugar phosphate nucleotidyltransferase [Paenibacillus protaetiae]|nr:sugar phosphate nucleotidyltransferase [Paenibacillus protaetiae]
MMMAGGNDQHLWPLANSLRADQFVPLLERPDGGKESIVQRIWRQLEAADLQDYAHVCTTLEQAELLQKQLGQLTPVVLEPVQRGTYWAAALAAAYFHSIACLSMNETIIVLPANIGVQQSFYDCIRSLPKLLKDSGNELMLIGIRAEEPAAERALILTDSRGDEADFYSKVLSFNGQPSIKEGERLAAEGAYWHSGAFAFRLGFMIERLLEEGLSAHYGELFRQYEALSSRSFATLVQDTRTGLVEYAGQWTELQDWQSLRPFLHHDLVVMEQAAGREQPSCLFNELDLPIVVEGFSNIMVAASRDGIRITNLDGGERGQNGYPKAEEDRIRLPLPMTEEKRWGRAEVLGHSSYADGHQVSVRRLRMDKGKNLDYEIHLNRSEYWMITAGEAELLIDERPSTVKTGDTVIIPPRTRHSLKALTDLEWVELQMGDLFSGNDAIVISSTWDELGLSSS